MREKRFLYLLVLSFLPIILLSGCGGGDSANSLSSPNTPPVANAGKNSSVALGTVVTLDGTGSFDANDDNLSYNWTVIERPVDSLTNLSLASSVSPVLVLDVDGNYIIQLIVNDGSLDSAAISVTVTASSAIGVLDIKFGNDINLMDGIPDGFVVHHDAAGGNQNDSGQASTLDQFGRIYVTGYSYNAEVVCEMVIWRYAPDGSPDTTFGNGSGFVTHSNAAGGNDCDSGQAITLDQAGRIYVTGHSMNAAGNNDMVVWRYTSEGSLDTTFGADTGLVVHDNAAGGYGYDFGEAIYIDSDDRIYVTGYSQNAAMNHDMVVWRFTSNGSLDSTFGNGKGFVAHDNAAGGYGNDFGLGISLDSVGNIYIAGYSWSAAGNYDMIVWRFTSNGSLDSTFGNGKGFVAHDNAAGGYSYDFGQEITLDSVGNIYIAGYSWSAAGNYDMIVWRFTSNGNIDTTFGNGKGFVAHDNAAGGNYHDMAHSIALDQAGRVYLTGCSINSLGNNDMVVWRFTHDGILDTTFGNSNGFVTHDNTAGGSYHDRGNSITLDDAGSIFVAGESTSFDGWKDMVVWKFN